MCLAIWGNDFFSEIFSNKAILELVERKWTQKSAFLAFFAILGQKRRFFDFILEKVVLFFYFLVSAKEARRSKIDPKIDTFGHIDTRVLAILVVKKIDFCTFQSFFRFV